MSSKEKKYKIKIITPVVKKTIILDDETEEYLFEDIVRITNGEKITMLMITDIKLKSHYIDIAHGFYIEKC